jgi:hypothetical protein
MAARDTARYALEEDVVPEWKYRKINLNEQPRRTDEIGLLCDAGEDGWELVTNPAE